MAKIIRSCIVCGSDAHTPLFTYTWDFLTKTRWSPPEELRQLGWDENTTSTVVKCAACGCIYTRDVVPYPPAAETGDARADHDGGSDDRESPRHYRKIDAALWTVRNLVTLATHRQNRAIRFLDFGAGTGTLCNVARALGLQTVVGYDPYSPSGENAYRERNFPGIVHARHLDELRGLAPFDAVACQSVIEHVLDPRAELRLIHSLMSPGGVLYINNPYMPLDKELAALKSATKITKRDAISYYHQHHFNYMAPRHFERLAREAGFRALPLAYFPPIPFAPGLRGAWAVRTAKCLYRGVQHWVGIDYGRQYYILERMT